MCSGMAFWSGSLHTGKMRTFLMQLFYYVVFTECIQGSAPGGLKWVRVNVPQYRSPGEVAQLQCDYDLGNDTLYTVKWYKEHEEFYRFVPKSRPPANSYKVDGVHVDMSLSDKNKVVLRNVNLKTSGLFKCEVSAEAPSFSSAQSEARMEVVYLSKENPNITGFDVRYGIGDEINLNCTSGKSHPASVIHWFINEQQVTSPQALIYYPPVHHRHGLISVTLGLRFTLSSRHFLGGSMEVKCIASVAPVLRKGDRESVVQNVPIKDMREALLLVRSNGGSKPVYYVTFMVISCLVLVFTT